jgi:hypothetical protein
MEHQPISDEAWERSNRISHIQGSRAIIKVAKQRNSLAHFLGEADLVNAGSVSACGLTLMLVKRHLV